MRRIVSVSQDMSWEEFYTRYKNFFPISNPEKRDAKLKEEYKRLTGKTVDGKIKGSIGKSKRSKRTSDEGVAFGGSERFEQRDSQP